MHIIIFCLGDLGEGNVGHMLVAGHEDGILTLWLIPEPKVSSSGEMKLVYINLSFFLLCIFYLFFH